MTYLGIVRLKSPSSKSSGDVCTSAVSQLDISVVGDARIARSATRVRAASKRRSQCRARAQCAGCPSADAQCRARRASTRLAALRSGAQRVRAGCRLRCIRRDQCISSFRPLVKIQVSWDREKERGRGAHLTSSAMAPTVFSMGTVGSGLRKGQGIASTDNREGHVPVHVVQIHVVHCKTISSIA